MNQLVKINNKKYKVTRHYEHPCPNCTGNGEYDVIAIDTGKLILERIDEKD